MTPFERLQRETEAQIAAMPDFRSDAQGEMRRALEAAIKIADEARDEWDAAPSGMKAGKLLIALSGRLRGYRADIDAIHDALARARGENAP